jgi:hypothetical protein
MRGREELRADAEALLRAFPDLCMEQKSRYECGDSVCIIKEAYRKLSLKK